MCVCVNSQILDMVQTTRCWYILTIRNLNGGWVMASVKYKQKPTYLPESEKTQCQEQKETHLRTIRPDTRVY